LFAYSYVEKCGSSILSACKVGVTSANDNFLRSVYESLILLRGSSTFALFRYKETLRNMWLIPPYR